MIVSSPIIPSIAMLMSRRLLELRYLLQSCSSGWEESVATRRGRAGRDAINANQALGIILQDLLHRIIVTQLTLYLSGHFVSR
jgi:hypothetical protein